MIFDTTVFNDYICIFGMGMGIGFTIGFISWGIGFAIYGIIKLINLG